MSIEAIPVPPGAPQPLVDIIPRDFIDDPHRNYDRMIDIITEWTNHHVFQVLNPLRQRAGNWNQQDLDSVRNLYTLWMRMIQTGQYFRDIIDQSRPIDADQEQDRIRLEERFQMFEETLGVWNNLSDSLDGYLQSNGSGESIDAVNQAINGITEYFPNLLEDPDHWLFHYGDGIQRLGSLDAANQENPLIERITTVMADFDDLDIDRLPIEIRRDLTLQMIDLWNDVVDWLEEIERLHRTTGSPEMIYSHQLGQFSHRAMLTRLQQIEDVIVDLGVHQDIIPGYHQQGQ